MKVYIVVDKIDLDITNPILKVFTQYTEAFTYAHKYYNLCYRDSKLPTDLKEWIVEKTLEK